VGGTPVIEYLLQRMWAAKPDEVRVVTRPEKQDVVHYADRRGASVIEDHPATLSASILTGMRGLRRDDVVLLGFPDSIWEPVDGFVRLLDVLEDGADAALGLFHMAEPQRSDVVETDSDGRVLRIDVRPAKPKSNRIWGCAALRTGVLQGLREGVQVGTLLGEVSRRAVIRGVDLSDLYLDIGTPKGLEEAQLRLKQASSGPVSRPSIVS
jgi:NDP-sugar pyrophosphorylase family protein